MNSVITITANFIIEYSFKRFCLHLSKIKNIANIIKPNPNKSEFSTPYNRVVEINKV